tara:strand:- start:142 stop:627 length:486 start_codon:yes stop_codon:yes gene_type:complete
MNIVNQTDFVTFCCQHREHLDGLDASELAELLLCESWAAQHVARREQKNREEMKKLKEEIAELKKEKACSGIDDYGRDYSVGNSYDLVMDMVKTAPSMSLLRWAVACDLGEGDLHECYTEIEEPDKYWDHARRMRERVKKEEEEEKKKEELSQIGVGSGRP